MPDRNTTIGSVLRGLRRRLPSAQTVAQAAAAAGEPTPLLARDAFERSAGAGRLSSRHPGP
jgi:hypothetical protein